MTSFSASCLARSFQELHLKSPEGAKTDFMIISGEHEIPVHSWVLAMRSDVLRTAMLGDFSEKKERKITIQGFSSNAVEEMIRFLYGFDVDDEFEEVEELLALGEMYHINDIKVAAAMNLDRCISEERVFTIAEVAQKHNADEAYEKCINFIVKNFKIQKLIQDATLEKFPKLAISILKKHPNLDQTTVRVYNNLHPRYLLDYTNGQTHQLCFSVDQTVLLTGIGLFVSPDSKGELTAEITIKQDGYVAVTTHKDTLKNTDADRAIVQVSLDPTKLTKNQTYKIQAIISGPGFSNAGSGRAEQVIADGLNATGGFVKKVTFSFEGKSSNVGQIPELYFNVC